MSHIAKLQDTDVTTLECALEVGLNQQEFDRACEILGRIPNKVELGCFSAMWSEHCSYKSSRLHLGRLPSTGERVVVGPGENAGVIDIGDGEGVCFKVESHNHPSFIEPYQGAATGVGGILRDVFTMGARPIAAANLLRFGQPDHKKTPHLVSGVVKGIGDYGNCFGVPTVYSDSQFHPSYNGNILVNAFALGIVKHDKIFKGVAQGVGNPVYYLGAKTGRDGIHGATMASDSFSEHEEAERPTVQVGDPFKEKLLLETCLACFQTDVLVGIQDMGAAGLTSSSFEMASRTGAGIVLDLDKIPTRETGMTAYEKMLSESQERMLLVAQKGKEKELETICSRWGLDCVEVGTVSDDGLVRLHANGQEVAVMPARDLADEAPRYDRPQETRAVVSEDERIQALREKSVSDVFGALLNSPTISDRNWIYDQYDREVLIGTLADGQQLPSAVVQIPHSQKAISLCLVSNDWLCSMDAREGAVRTIAEAVLRTVCVGALPVGVSDCLNYGNPEKPEVMRDFATGIDGLAEACNAFSIPVVSGNVSLYNETDELCVNPTPTIAMVGLLPDAEARLEASPRSSDHLYRIGKPAKSLEGARVLEQVSPSNPHLSLERWDYDNLREMVTVMEHCRAQSCIRSAVPVTSGGVAGSLARWARQSGAGMDVSIPGEDELVASFGEDSPALLVAVPEEKRDTFLGVCRSVETAYLGRVGGEHFSLSAGDSQISVPVTGLREISARQLMTIVNAKES